MRKHSEIAYNYHEYSDNDVYITMGINVGLATKYFSVDNEKNLENNIAFANIFANYLKKIYKDKYITDVDRTMITLSYLSCTETMGQDLFTFINEVCNLDIRTDIFEKAKAISIEKFKKVYKDGAFRGWYKSFEIADLNKGYLFKQLIDGLKNMTYEEFTQSYSILINLYNSAIYVNGKIRDLTREEVMGLKRLFDQKTYQAILGGKRCDPYLRGDAHLLEIARESVNIDVLAFSFNEKVSIFDRMIYLDIEAEKIPYQDRITHVDAFDASIIVNESDLMKLKNLFRESADAQHFIRNQAAVLGRYSNWLEMKPERFGKWCVELMLSGITPTEYLSVLSKLSYDTYTDIFQKIRPIVTEAQIVMRR